MQAAKFVTVRKSRELIRKLESLVSRYQAEKLHRQVYITGRVKTMNESIYYNIDRIHEAINAGMQVRFQYGQWNVRKELELRHDGASYQVSPWALTWDNEKYYLVAYDADADKIKHYRVDKMLRIRVINKPRLGKDTFKVDGTGEKFRCLVFSFYEREDGKNHELIRFYITDDTNHIPVRLDMFLSFGSAKVFLKGYKGVRSPMTSKIK